jgi:hypothetical protein
MAALVVHTMLGEDRLQGLLNRLLSKKAGYMIGHVVVVYEGSQTGLVTQGLGEQFAGHVRAVTSRQAPVPR